MASAAHGLLAGRHSVLPRPVSRGRPRLPTLREAHVARSSIRRGTTGRRTFGQTLPGRSSWAPTFLPAPRGHGHSARINACPDGGRGQKLPKYGADDILWDGCRPGRQVSADPYSGAMRRTNCGSQTRSWMTPSSRGAVVRRYFSSSGVAFASTQGTARRMWR
jgi:hypothetical protein